MKTRILFMGTPEFCVPILETLINNYDVIGVVSQPNKLVGRKQILTETPIAKVATTNKLLLMQPKNIKEEYLKIKELNPDLIVTCAYGQIVPEEILNLPKLGSINVHASLLPKLRGGAPIHKALIEGFSKTGITIMYMDKGMDTGDIISKREVVINDSDNLETLSNKLSETGVTLLLDTLPSIINKTNKRDAQNNEEATYAYNITKEEEHLDFTKTSREVFNKIRGLSPIPGCYAIIDNKRMKIYEGVITNTNKNGTCGEILEINKTGIVVKTKDKDITLTIIQPEGKKKVNAKDYANGNKKNLIGKIFN